MLKKTFGIIPARLGSTRLKEKMLLPIDNKPLIQHTYENAKKCSRLDGLFIATDSKEIFDIAQGFGAEVLMTSETCKNGTERIFEAFSTNERLRQANILVNIQGDEPLLEPEVISAVITTLAEDPSAVVSTAIVPLKETTDTSVVKCVTDLQGYALYFSRSLIPGNKSGRFKPTIKYYRHLGIYAYRTSFLPEYAKLEETPLQQAEDLEQLKILEHGYNLKTTVVNSTSIGVDTEDDLNKVKEILCKKNTSSSQAESAPR